MDEGRRQIMQERSEYTSRLTTNSEKMMSDGYSSAEQSLDSVSVTAKI